MKGNLTVIPDPTFVESRGELAYTAKPSPNSIPEHSKLSATKENPSDGGEWKSVESVTLERCCGGDVTPYRY
jgi:hypothetical protein